MELSGMTSGGTFDATRGWMLGTETHTVDGLYCAGGLGPGGAQSGHGGGAGQRCGTRGAMTRTSTSRNVGVSTLSPVTRAERHSPMAANLTSTRSAIFSRSSRHLTVLAVLAARFSDSATLCATAPVLDVSPYTKM